MANTWTRKLFAPLAWSNSAQHQLIASVSSGDTILRARYGWGFTGCTSTDVDAASIASNWCTAGLVTTVGNGTESVPDPVTQSADQDPPTQRWLWWETRTPQVIVFDAGNGIAWFQGSAPQEADDSHGQVLAAGLPSGDTLNLWFSWKSHSAWDDTGRAQIWLGISVLVKSP